jgi:hypothetical protein
LRDLRKVGKLLYFYILLVLRFGLGIIGNEKLEDNSQLFCSNFLNSLSKAQELFLNSRYVRSQEATERKD